MASLTLSQAALHLNHTSLSNHPTKSRMEASKTVIEHEIGCESRPRLLHHQDEITPSSPEPSLGFLFEASDDELGLPPSQ
ncbi:hypothetical protein Tco_0493419 [Tanacetum coccineum]